MSALLCLSYYLPKRKVPHLVLEVLALSSRCQQMQVIDSGSNGEVLGDHHHPWKGKTFPQACVCMSGHRLSVVGEEDAAGPSGPFQNIRVPGLRQAQLAQADHINPRDPPLQTPEDAVIEVLVRREPGSPRGQRPSLARSFFRKPSGGNRFSIPSCTRSASRSCSSM